MKKIAYLIAMFALAAQCFLSLNAAKDSPWAMRLPKWLLITMTVIFTLCGTLILLSLFMPTVPE